ncbi:MAG: thioredoxin-like domain-containing protein [candidate division KSB1 bacterium]|nr:thioredoxin-like domain-containing protein [candidate division KSB1 bacterium]MDZ7366526.1 thioredoxin-like domain-containing protein [candidate division KSB1 bacterium]MDZ7405991.1 thioredoxin-like domain-containing protein [candidate division KSB1 bacterium]
MKKVFAAVTMLGVLLAQAFAQQPSVISGKLLGHDGKPMLKAQVHLLPNRGERKALQSVEVAKDGGFEVNFDQTGLAYLNFTGVDHYELMMPLLIEKPLREKMVIRLKPYEYPDDFSQVKIIGDFNQFNFGSAKPMVPQSDGTFTFETEATAATFAYQILGAEKSGRSINGTQSDDFAYDDGGDYRSVVNVAEGRVKIVFDPKKIIRAKPGDEAVVKFDNPNSFTAKFYALQSEQNKRQEKFSAAVRAYQEAHQKDMSGFSYDWSTELTAFSKRIAAEKDPMLRQVLLKHYLEIGSMNAPDKLDKKLIAQAFAEIPATSLLWAMSSPRLISVAVNWSGEKEKYENYLNEALEKNPSRSLRANILSMKLSEVTFKGDTTNARIYFERLMKDFGDTPEAQRAKNQYDPNRRILKGKQAPAFKVASLDQAGVTYSNESMKGKIYLIDFWAVWCGPCVMEMPNLHKAYEKFKDKNFEILSLSFDPNPEEVAKFRRDKWKMPWLHTFVEQGFGSELAKSFEVMGIPKPILVDGNTNTILATEMDLRGDRLEKTLAGVLGEKIDMSSAEKK